jgi:hypothetical protein
VKQRANFTFSTSIISFNVFIISLEIREYGHRDPSRCPRGTLYPQKLTLTSPTGCGRPVGVVCLRTQATEFSLVYGGCETAQLV